MEPATFPRRCPGGLAVPLFFIAAGVILLLNNLGVVWLERVWDLWPVAFLAAGVEQLVARR
jgi:hypothetical protein